MKKHLKLFALATAFIMLFNLFPLTALASELDRLKTIDVPSSENKVKQQGKIVTELVDKRERNVKRFLLDDNKQLAAIYPVPVHYLDNGVWKDIDNSLIDTFDEDNNNVLENKANDYKVKISKQAKSDKLIRIQKDKYEISWGISSPNDSSIIVTSKNENELYSLPDNDKKTSLLNISSEVNFKNIYQNVDLKYNINPSEVKESIILNNKTDNPVFSFNVKVKDLTAKLNEDKTISFYDSNNIKKEIFRMKSPYMFDAAGNESSNIDIAFERTTDGYALTIKPSIEWLNSNDTVYPVTIDPQISTSLNSDDIFDAHVSSNYPATNYRTSVILKTGIGALSGINRTFIKFNLPNLSSSDLITYAVFNAISINHSGSAASQVNVHEVLGGWDSSTITWNNKPPYNTKIEDYCLIQSSAWQQWDITNIAKKWYSTGNNYGLMLRDLNETTNYDEYYSSDTGTTTYRPFALIY